MNTPGTVVVAMSGGVDSSVAAALLKEQGYRVIGMMMRLWSEPGSEEDNRCCTPDSMNQARRVAARLGIPFYSVDSQEVFYSYVVQNFIKGYTEHTTPNPCLACNRHIRWEFLLQRAIAAGADRMATGHYVRLVEDTQGIFHIHKGVDEQKDQSYVLHVLNQEQLRHAIFPLGGLTKPEVRQLARDFQLPVAERAESQDLCFLGSQNYRDFLKRNAPEVVRPGPIMNRAGKILGEHQGLAFYTIGQRKGLGVTGPTPFYVLEKDILSNALIIGPVEELGYNQLIASNINWINPLPPQKAFRAEVKIRYKARETWATVTPVDHSRAVVQFDQRMRDITPGQAAVFYTGEECLGGGIIQSVR